MRRKLIALYTFIIFIFVTFMPVEILKISENLYSFYIKNSYIDTFMENVVTAIYLQYRVFDTLFEALLLLVSIVGIIYFSRHEGDYH